MTRPDGARASPLPPISRPLLAWFGRYARRYLARSFHAVRVLESSGDALRSARAARGPLVVYMNHPSWWDPLVALTLAREWFPSRVHRAPIDADALSRYPFFARLGFFGVRADALEGARSFLEMCDRATADPRCALWITPQGAFADVRDRPLRFEGGLERVLRRSPGVTVVPLAVEYTFWNERTPEALAAVGHPFPSGVAHCGAELRDRLQVTLDELAAASVARDPARFVSVVDGRVGVGGLYDVWRRARALVSGRRAHLGHDERSGEAVGGRAG